MIFGRTARRPGSRASRVTCSGTIAHSSPVPDRAGSDVKHDSPDPELPDQLPDRMKGPGGLTLRQIHAQVRTSAERDRATQKVRNPLTQPHNRWQRFVRYVWGRSGRR